MIDDRDETTLWAMERQFWLSGAEAFGSGMHRAALMVFPRPTGILQGDDLLASLDGAPRWEHVAFTERQRVSPADGLAILAYRAEARRGDTVYTALCGSGYSESAAGWQIVFHQQTPET